MGKPNLQVPPPVGIVRVREILSKMRAAALLATQSRFEHELGNDRAGPKA